MVKAGRVKRLRDLIAQIESLPASPDRDRLLNEFRSRAVDVDTGVTPRAILPLREPAPAPARARTRTVTRMAPSTPAAEEPASSHDEPFFVTEWLSLDDTPVSTAPQDQGSGGRPVPPWTLGLRG